MIAVAGAERHAGQMLLPFLDDVCLEDVPKSGSSGGRPARDRRFRLEFCKAYLLQGEKNAKRAYQKAREVCGLEPATESGAASQAHKLLRAEDVRVTLEHLRQVAAREAELTLAEFNRGTRAVLAAGLGEAPLRKTIVVPVTVTSDEGEDEIRERATLEALVFEPNLAAAKGALELMGKVLGVFSERLNLGLSHDEALELLDEVDQPEGA